MLASPCPWIRSGLAGVYILRNVDGDSFDRTIRHALRRYDGPDIGGVDVMVPGPTHEAWLLIGSWVDCLQPEVQRGARLLLECLATAVELENAGVQLDPGGAATVDARRAFDAIDGARRVSVDALYAYQGTIAIPWWHGTTRADVEAIFPSLPGFVGAHMGAPHWMGRGMTRDGDRIVSVTPYLRLDFVPESGIRVSAMCEPTSFDEWLIALRRATRWW